MFPRFISDTVSCLRKKESSELLAKEYEVEPYSINFFPFVPTLDGEFLTQDPEKLLKIQAFSSEKPILIGSNANEGFWSLMYYLSDIFPLKELEEEDMELGREEYTKAVDALLGNNY